MLMEKMITRIADVRTDLVFELIRQGFPVNSSDSQGITIIKWCAYYGDVSAIKFLLSKGESLASLGDNYDLNGAAFHGHWQLCQFLLESGADARSLLTATAESPLHSSLCHANRPVTDLIVELLLAYGADPNGTNIPGVATGAFMRDAYTCGETPLHRAAAFGSEKTIKLLLEAGADKTRKDAHGNSPLSWASWHLRPAKILSLLTYGNYQIHPLHLEKMQSDHGAGWGGGMYLNLLGKVHY
jgi:uncharacterized protein